MCNHIYDDTIEHIQREYTNSTYPWFLGFSGGKDSSALLNLVYGALINLKKRDKEITIIYCDTGVEIPVIRDFVYKVLNNISIEAHKNKVPIKTKIVYPDINDRYFVNLIGKGYPPPTNKFRWCTDRLRIKPINKILRDISGNQLCIMLLGIRKGESRDRDKKIEKYGLDISHYFLQSRKNNVTVYSPIINYDLKDVWYVLLRKSYLESIDFNELANLYNIIPDDKRRKIGQNQKAFNKRRFGCWTCTVVRKDKAMEGLIIEGLVDLEPLLSFRDWLMVIRDEPSYRCKKRRNEEKSLGPFTLKARKEILNKLLKTQAESPWKLIYEEEIDIIEYFWERDKD